MSESRVSSSPSLVFSRFADSSRPFSFSRINSQVDFDVPLKRWKEARPKMLAMRDQAAKALAIVRPNPSLSDRSSRSLSKLTTRFSISPGRKQSENPTLPPFTNPPMWPEQALIITVLVIQFLTYVLPDS